VARPRDGPRPHPRDLPPDRAQRARQEALRLARLPAGRGAGGRRHVLRPRRGRLRAVRRSHPGGRGDPRMNHDEIWSKLTGTFRWVLADDALTRGPETTAKDVPEWDSRTHFELLVAVEQAFKVRFNSGEVTRLPNVGAMVELIGAK